jgi:hypothetical protein
MIESFCHDAVALTGSFFETVPINNGNFAALVADQACVLEGASSHCDASAWSAHHIGDDFLGKMKSVTIHAVVGYQEPAAESRLQFVESIKKGRFRDMSNQRVWVVE